MPFKYKEFERKLTRLRYKVARQKGSHVIFSDRKNTFSVPNHGSKDIQLDDKFKKNCNKLDAL